MDTENLEKGSISSTNSKPATSSTPTSSSSTKQSDGSIKRWKKPQTIKQFAAQINQVATMILNEEIPIETAYAYSRLTRNFAHIITTETAKNRFLKKQTDLELEEDIFE